ncbi:hypothetical protein, partial [Arthrobacter sp. AZCC_0090]|uniref:hypothetical protein n=1 Tax=Arthrobacter sp. AZCC_0090 TaxID=2735881 RepID=UPI0021A98154
MLEGQLRVDIDETAGHHKVLGNPFGIGAFKGLDLVLGDPVEFLARNVVVDLGGTIAVWAVGTTEIRRIRHPCGALFPGSAAEVASVGTGAVELAGAALGPIAEAAALTVAFTARAVAKRLTIAITKAGPCVAITTRTVAEGLTIAITKTRPRIPITTRTITERLTIAITKTRPRIPITTRTITERLTIAITKTRTRVAFTARTVAEGLTIAITKTRPRIPITTRTITERLTIAITKTRT